MTRVKLPPNLELIQSLRKQERALQKKLSTVVNALGRAKLKCICHSANFVGECYICGDYYQGGRD